MDYRVRWQQRRRQRAQKRLLAIPAALALAGLIYVLMRLFAGGGHVYWIYEQPGHLVPRFTAGPAILHVAWSDGHIDALKARDGLSLTSGPFFSTAEPFNTQPLLANHTLYVASDLGMLRALDARSGQRLWEFDAQSPIRARPVAEGGRLYFGNDAGKVYAFAAGGTKLWARELDAAVSGEGAIIGDRVFFATTRGTVYALKRSDGTMVWHRALATPIFSPVTAADPLLLVGSDAGRLYVLKAADGTPAREPYPTTGLVRQAAAVTTEAICFGSTDGWLRAVSRDGQTPLWARYLGGPVTAGPVTDGKHLYAASASRAYAVQPASGRIRRVWKGEQFSGDLVIQGDTAYVGTTIGRIVALVAP